MMIWNYWLQKKCGCHQRKIFKKLLANSISCNISYSQFGIESTHHQHLPHQQIEMISLCIGVYCTFDQDQQKIFLSRAFLSLRNPISIFIEFQKYQQLQQSLSISIQSPSILLIHHIILVLVILFKSDLTLCFACPLLSLLLKLDRQQILIRSIYFQRYYFAINMKSSNSSIRLQQIRRKYDTPTKREEKENYSRSSMVRRDDERKSLANVRENMIEKSGVEDMKSSISKRILEDHGIKTKMTSSIMGSKGQVYDSKNYESIQSSVNSITGYDSRNRGKDSFKGDEEAVLKRIKDMKQSLMTKNTYERNRPPSSIYDDKKKSIGRPEDNNTTHRIDNIDQINSKIQQILNCLKQNENRKKYHEDGPSNHTEKKIVGSETGYSSKTNFTNNRQLLKNKYIDSSTNKKQFTIPQSASIYQQSKNKAQFTIPQSASAYQQSKNKAAYSPLQQKINGFRLSENRRDTSRAKSFINSVQKETGCSYELHSGKKLDDEISKINDKIKRFEEEKKKLNIQFTPYSFTHSKSSSDLTKRGFTIHKDKKIDDTQKQEHRYSYSKCKQNVEERFTNRFRRQEQNNRIRTFVEDKTNNLTEESILKKYMNNDSFNENPTEKNQKDFEIKLFPVTSSNNSSSIRQSGNISFNMDSQETEKDQESISQEYINNTDSIRKKTEEGILGRKARLGKNQSIKSSVQTKKLIKALCQQAKLDQQFRNNKIWFDADLHKDKWQTLSQLLKNKHSSDLSLSEIKAIFALSDQENNPFYSVRNQTMQSYNNLINSYKQSIAHWNEHIMNKFDRSKLRQEQFCEDKLDLQKKGYIVLQDLVRFLNIETGTFYRNRDLFLALRRISPKQQITLQQLLVVFCRKD